MSTKWEILKAENTHNIIAAAKDEFIAKGYTRTRVTDIAKIAGISSALIFKYYKTKEDLFYALVRGDSLTKLYEGHEDVTPDKALAMYVDHIKQYKSDGGRQFKLWLMITQSKDIPDSVFDRLKADFSGSVLERAIIKAQEAGDLPQGTTWDVYMLLFVSICNIISRYVRIGAEAPDSESILHIIQYKRAKRKYYRCPRCGQVVAIVESSGKPLYCCNTPMQEVEQSALSN